MGITLKLSIIGAFGVAFGFVSPVSVAHAGSVGMASARLAEPALVDKVYLRRNSVASCRRGPRHRYRSAYPARYYLHENYSYYPAYSYYQIYPYPYPSSSVPLDSFGGGEGALFH